jgi:hypothetical protein
MLRTEQTFTIGQGVTAVSAMDLEAVLSGPHIPIPGDLQADVDALVQDVKSKLSARVKSNLDQGMSAARAQPTAGGPITAGYEYLDLLTLSPQQFLIPGAVYRPHKLVAAGEFALLLAVLFINPTPTPGGGPSATMHLGGRPYRIRFEQVDLTNLANGPDFTFTGIFPSPAPFISVWPVGIVPPDPGQNPRLVELNVTMDVPLALQPYAAFATQWIDIEDDPGFPFPQPGGLRNQTPLRYLVYPVT